MAFKANYVPDVLNCFEGDVFSFSFNQSLSPAAMRPINDDNFTYIVTPVRTAH